MPGLEHFTFPTGSSIPRTVTTQSSISSSPGGTVVVIVCNLHLPLQVMSGDGSDFVVLCAWLLSFSTTFSMLPCYSICQCLMSSYCQIILHAVHMQHFPHLSISRRAFGLFALRAVLNNAATNICVHLCEKSPDRTASYSDYIVSPPQRC